ncbi:MULTISPECIES: penicillin-binding protein 2 [unclassified Roseitalea]|uniref:peptidoglycan D,D-transpeptidase FtsI family protein n=1 Tax=unclassified Roseitalea TaxID=2639107 RepID=UPI00273DFE1E|nr:MULTISPECIES: penicillin-binding protein 2 [unclassified Roseitalea]
MAFAIPGLGLRGGKASDGGRGPATRRGDAIMRMGRGRIAIAIACFVGVYAVIGGRLVQYGLTELDDQARYGVNDRIMAARPDLLDRRGNLLATDIRVASLYGEPRRIIDPDEAVEALSSVLPDVDYKEWHRKLSSGAGFVWLRREISPKEQAAVMALGIPGIGFRNETRRFYPGGPTASHIVGLVNIDNAGTAGIEKFVDDQGLATLQEMGLDQSDDLEPVRLSIDAGVQHIVRDELVQAMERYQAIAAGGVVLDVRTGEVVAMVSLPDYDPNNPFNALDKDRLNRMSAGTFEMGSTFKAFTTAMALDSGQVTLDSRFDARKPLRFGRFTINDFHGKNRVLTVPETFIYSSNIATARMAEVIGVEGHRAFLKRMGLLDRMDTQLPEVARPTEPDQWKQLNSVTISFGHGVSTTPLQTAVAAAALVNGGRLIPPSFIPRSQDAADRAATQVLKPETSAMMRYLFRLNVEEGSGRRAEVEGLFVGGKTGTAEKVVNGRYSGDHRFNAFLAAFPMDDPEYVVLVIIDEPKPAEGQYSATAGLNAAPTTRAIISRAAPVLPVTPRYDVDRDALLVSY